MRSYYGENCIGIIAKDLSEEDYQDAIKEGRVVDYNSEKVVYSEKIYADLERRNWNSYDKDGYNRQGYDCQGWKKGEYEKADVF